MLELVDVWRNNLIFYDEYGNNGRKYKNKALSPGAFLSERLSGKELPEERAEVVRGLSILIGRKLEPICFPCQFDINSVFTYNKYTTVKKVNIDFLR
ncbi:MAG: hypothetical protein PHI00_00500 [Atribacterota bacterium]|nr:hypothetical protein [Atribacterota bacterium]